MSNAERQKAWRKRNPYTSKRLAKERMQRRRGAVTNEPVRNEETNVRNALMVLKRAVREVPETHYETDDEAWEREHGPPPAPRVKESPVQEVVIPDVIQTAEERRIEEWLEANKNRRAAPDKHTVTLKIQVAMTSEERRAMFNVMKESVYGAQVGSGTVEVEME